MLDALRQLLESSHLLALFLAIGGGYALGQVTVSGFSLGVSAVLFAGLAIGAFAPGTAPPGIVGTIGLVMFLYGIGIQYGRQFFQGLTGGGSTISSLWRLFWWDWQRPSAAATRWASTTIRGWLPGAG